MKISIDDVVFMTDDTVVFTEGINEYLAKFKKNKLIEPVTIFYQRYGKYYARGGRHRTYMFYNRLALRTMDVELLKNFPLDKKDRYHLKYGGVTIKDLTEMALPTS